MTVLDIRDLRTYFHTRNGVIRAVDGVTIDVGARETLGIVGESGSGKSVLCYSLLGLLPKPPARIESGQALFGHDDLIQSDRHALNRIRGKRIAMIFQDPMTCLNPYMTIEDQLTEPLRVHEGISKMEARPRAIQVLKDVGILDVERRLEQYPHEFSGGMRQRVMIAMALITRPEILIADEPTTGLDVTVQAQILELIRRLQKEMGMSVIFVTHDLGVIASVADRVVVMYAGRIVETGSVRDIFAKPTHPYTKALLQSIPGIHTKSYRGPTGKRELYSIPGLPPDPSRRVEGCRFAPRCEFAEEACRSWEPVLADVAEGQKSACLRRQKGTWPV